MVVISNVVPGAVIVETSVSVCVRTLMLSDVTVEVAVEVRVTVVKPDEPPVKMEATPEGPITIVTGRPDADITSVVLAVMVSVLV